MNDTDSIRINVKVVDIQDPLLYSNLAQVKSKDGRAVAKRILHLANLGLLLESMQANGAIHAPADNINGKKSKVIKSTIADTLETLNTAQDATDKKTPSEEEALKGLGF